MKQQRIERAKSPKAPTIIDNRQPNLPDPQNIDPAVANLPLRTVFMVDVKDMTPPQVQVLVQQINNMYSGNKGGIHYVLPIRHGKISSDLIFECEILEMIKKICEVDAHGEIVLKNGATECQIVRQNI